MQMERTRRFVEEGEPMLEVLRTTAVLEMVRPQIKLDSNINPCMLGGSCRALS